MGDYPVVHPSQNRQNGVDLNKQLIHVYFYRLHVIHTMNYILFPLLTDEFNRDGEDN